MGNPFSRSPGSDLGVDAGQRIKDGLVEHAGAVRSTGQQLAGAMDRTSVNLVGAMDRTSTTLVGAMDRTSDRLVGVVDRTSDRLVGVVDRTSDRLVGAMDRTSDRLVGVVDRTSDRLVGAMDRSTTQVSTAMDNATQAVLNVGTQGADSVNHVGNAIEHSADVVQRAAEVGVTAMVLSSAVQHATMSTMSKNLHQLSSSVSRVADAHEAAVSVHNSLKDQQVLNKMLEKEFDIMQRLYRLQRRQKKKPTKRHVFLVLPPLLMQSFILLKKLQRFQRFIHQVSMDQVGLNNLAKNAQQLRHCQIIVLFYTSRPQTFDFQYTVPGNVSKFHGMPADEPRITFLAPVQFLSNTEVKYMDFSGGISVPDADAWAPYLHRCAVLDPTDSYDRLKVRQCLDATCRLLYESKWDPLDCCFKASSVCLGATTVAGGCMGMSPLATLKVVGLKIVGPVAAIGAPVVAMAAATAWGLSMHNAEMRQAPATDLRLR